MISPFPAQPDMRPYYAYVNGYVTLDLFFYFFHEILYLRLLICAVLIKFGKGILKEAKFITYGTRLDLLLTQSRTDNSNWKSLCNFLLLVVYIYSVDTLRIVVSLEDLQCVFIHHMFKLLEFYIKRYAYTFFIIIDICKILSPKLRPHNLLFLLWLYELVLLISSDIETKWYGGTGGKI